MAAITEFVQERLTQIEQAPEMWGSLQTIEFTILQLIEIELYSSTGRKGRFVLDAWLSDIRRHHPDAGPYYLSSILGDDGDPAVLVRELARFRKHLVEAPGPIFPLRDTPNAPHREAAN